MEPSAARITSESPTQHNDDVSVQVTYVLPRRILDWAIAQVEKYGSRLRGHDHQIAILISTHKDSRVKEVHIGSP